MFVVGLALARLMKADRPIGPRGLPDGADEALYRDVYRSQFAGDDADFGLTGEDYGELGAPSGFTSYYESTASTSPGASPFEAGVRPGEAGGYNPSGGQGSTPGLAQSYGATAARNTAEGRGGDEKKGSTL
jgi:hypothetical protein